MSKKYAASIDGVADWFINRIDRDAGEAITHLKLQKLLYFAQAWYLANRGKRLFADDFQAWAHGPVARPIYDRFKGNSWQPLDAIEEPAALDEKVADYLELIFERYGQYSAKYLEQLTHEHQPWKEARGDRGPEERCEATISTDTMQKFYGKKIGKK